jgi:hypothetical protein
MTTQERNTIERRIKELEGGRFQEFMLKFLPLYDKGYEGILRNGHNMEGKTGPGHPDLLKTNSKGQQIGCECGNGKRYWANTDDKNKLKYSKPIRDLEACLSKLHNLVEIVLVSGQSIPPKSPNTKSNLIAYGIERGCRVIVLASQDLASWLESNMSQHNVLELIKEYFPDIFEYRNLLEENATLKKQFFQKIAVGIGTDGDSFCYLRLETLGENKDEVVIHNPSEYTLYNDGDSFCYLRLETLGENKDEVVIHNPSEYTLYNIEARIVDLDELERTKNIFRSQLNKSYGEIPAQHCKTTSTKWSLGNNNERQFNVFWTTRSGSFWQVIRFKKVGDHWSQALKVIRGDQVLYEQVDSDFPRTKQGLVNWE